MHQDTHGWVNLHDVAREMGLELDNKTAWAIGQRLVRAWLWQVGTLPLKDLRTKRKGIGVHCFALYPPAFKPRMKLIISAYKADEADQTEMPF